MAANTTRLRPARRVESEAVRNRKLAASAAAALSGFIPMAPSVSFVKGAAPGTSDTALNGSAAYAWDTDTIYHAGQMSKFERGHEMGHALDDQALSDGDRKFYIKLLGLSGPWNQGTGTENAGKRPPSEIFADWYGNAVAGNDPSRAWDSAYATAPSPKQFRRFEQSLARLGKRKQLKQYER